MSLDLSAARPYTLAAVVAGLSATAAVGGAALFHLPLRDPDSMAGPAWLRLPAIALAFAALDLVPRALARRRTAGGVRAAYRQVLHERWDRERVGLVALALASFYVTYVSYRNVKGYLPFVETGLVDGPMLSLDRVWGLGAAPSSVLHAVLGTGLAAHVLSIVYLAFLVFVPVSLAASVVWFRDTGRGAWYVTAMCLDWAIGALSYYVLPTLGPVYARPGLFSDLPPTGASALQESLLANRVQVLTDPWATTALHGIGAFASLHAAIIFTAALVVHRARLAPLFRWVMWAYFTLTLLSTVYFGWHYVLDDIAGVGIGWFSVWAAGRATGNARPATTTAPERVLTAS
jgi:hypothetical protein